MNKLKLEIAEISLIFIISVITLITQPPLPLLAIPFLIIMSMRTIFQILMEEDKKQ